MSGSEAASSLQDVLDRARRLLLKAREYLSDLGQDELTPDGVEPVRVALDRLDQLLREGIDPILDEVRQGDGAAGADPAVPADDQVRTILEITRALSHVVEEDHLYEVIMDLVLKHSRAERGFLVLTSGDREELEIRAARNIDQKTIPSAEQEISGSIMARVRESGEPLLVPNALADSSLRLKESVAALRILSVLCAPIFLDGEMYGLIYLESRSVKDLFAEDDLRFVRAFCGQAGVALENSRAIQAARRAESRLVEENARLRAEVADRHAFQGIIGRSRRMQEIYELVQRVGPKPVSILIRGENGTGKEMIARRMHYNSPRAEMPFVSVNCAALPETLIESELFGIEKGTATGVDARPGKFEVASGGTLFLDEVGDMSLVVQAKLLRVLQEREIERVGGRKPVKVDVRIIAATNVDLEAAISAKEFREDLYYRLDVVPVWIPPLRDRLEDVPLLARHFLEKLSTEFGMEQPKLTSAAMDCLCKFSWPGNVRQLENILSRALVLSSEPEIDVSVLPPEIQEAGGAARRSLSLGGATLEDLEQAALVQALEKNEWVQTRAAGELGISERNLRYKMKKFSIKRPGGGRGGAK